jgi:hypothetical protein
MELTKNWRAEKDPEFKLFIDDLIKVRDGCEIDFSTYGKKDCRKSLAWTNMTRNIVNNKWMLKESEGKQCYILNYKKVFAGLPIIAKETRTLGDSEIFNNEEFDVKHIDSNKITISNTRVTMDIKHSDFKYFDLAYCITVHKSQGSTYDFEYTIHDYNFKHFSSKLLYTAMSRSTQKANINFMKSNYKVNTGHIYKITNLQTNKIYIGSTTTTIDQRFKEHKQTKDGSPLHTDMQLHDDWKIESIKEVKYIDDQELLIAETTCMMHYDSINTGYNTKYAVTLETLH